MRWRPSFVSISVRCSANSARHAVMRPRLPLVLLPSLLSRRASAASPTTSARRRESLTRSFLPPSVVAAIRARWSGSWTRQLGTVFGIAFGSFGELSPGLEKLLAEAAKKGGSRVCSDFLMPEGKPAECAAKQRLTRRWGMMAWRVRAAIIEGRMWALGSSRSPKRARRTNWERAQQRQSEHFSGSGRGGYACRQKAWVFG